jgi:hypothetical protein
MKKIDPIQVITLLANIGVIVGIVFLAVEIRQNNDQLSAQTRNTLYELRADIQRDFINNVGGITDIILKERRGEHLTDVEIARIGSRRRHILRTLEYMVSEDPEGVRLQINFMALMFRDNELEDAWNEGLAGGAYDAEFVTFVQENVLPQIRGGI